VTTTCEVELSDKRRERLAVSHGWAFRHRLVLTTVCLFVWASLSAEGNVAHVQGESSKPLEVELSAPPRWVNGCLDVRIDRVNRSSETLFMPVMGLYIYTSARAIGEAGEIESGRRWINVYGASDVLDWNAQPLAPGAALHDDHCLDSSVKVANLKQRTRRDIPLRGMLRIDAYYFLTEADWRRNESEREEMLRAPPAQMNKIVIHEPADARILVTIPCRGNDCTTRCSEPPLILRVEGIVLPDVWRDDPGENARGTAVTEELAKRYPGCPGPNPNTQ